MTTPSVETRLTRVESDVHNLAHAGRELEASTRESIEHLTHGVELVSEQARATANKLDEVHAELTGFRTETRERFSGVEDRLTGLETRMGNVENLLTQILARLPERS